MSRKHKRHREQASPVAKPASTPVAQSAHDVVGGERTELASRTFAASDSQNYLDPHAAEVQVAAEWKVGDVILDTYEVNYVHEGGGMGLVYRVHHCDWQEELAVKSPRPGYFATQDQRENFVRECVTWIGLGLHPHIVACYYVRLLGGIPRVFAEYVVGGTLQDWIKDRRLYEGGNEQALERMLDMAIQFARGLHYAHEKGVIHQDVKPGNVMLSPEGLVKVTDFGLARARAVSGETAVAGYRQSMLLSFGGGYTPAYCSPEQANKQPLTRRTDVWSWGVSVLEMFVGEVRWPSGTASAAALESYVEKVAEDDAIPRMPNELVDLLRECFQESEAQRPKDMAVIVERLKTIHQSGLGRSYVREEGQVTEATADVLNNQGLSFYNLGMEERAGKCFEQAIETNPLHLEATYNRGLHLWRSGKLKSQDVVGQLMNVAKTRPDDPIADYMMGLIHMERGDIGSAARIAAAGTKMQLSDTGRALMVARTAAGEEWQRLRIFEGHTDWWAQSVAISPDGRWALSGGSDKTLRLWDLASGQCLRTMEGHTGWVITVAINSDGRWGLSEGLDHTMRLWDLASGQCLRTFGEHKGVDRVAFSPDGRWGLSGCLDKTLNLWDLVSGQCLRTFEGHASYVQSVAISPDGRRGLSGSKGNTLKLWDLANGECLRTLEGHTCVTSLAFSPDGRLGLSGSKDNTLKLWDLASGECLRTLEGHTNGVTSLAFSPDGRWGLSGSRDRTLKLWDLASGECLRTFEGHANEVNSVTISPDGRWGLSGSLRSLRLWDLASSYRSAMMPTKPQRLHALVHQNFLFAKLVETAEAHLQVDEFDAALQCVKEARNIHGYERHLKISSVMDRLACHCKSAGIHEVWPIGTFEGHTSAVTSVAISPDGRWGLSGSLDKTLKLWELASSQYLHTLEGHAGRVHSVAISPDCRWGLSGSQDKTLKLWDLSSGECLRTFEGHANEVNSVAIGPDGRWGLSGSSDGTLRLWDLGSAKCLRSLVTRTAIKAVLISPDGRWGLGFSSGEYRPWLWDLASGQCLRKFEGHNELVESFAISPDGRWGLSGSLDKTLRLWDLGSGQCLRTFEGHTLGISSVAISPGGRWALSGSYDKSLRLWDLASGVCLCKIDANIEAPLVAIGPDGRWAMSGSRDGTLRLWRLDWNYEFPGWADWTEHARPYLSNFLTLHCSAGPDGFSRVGKPVWNEEHFQGLINDLQHRGYGWLRAEGVRRELEKMAAEVEQEAWNRSLRGRISNLFSSKRRKK